MIGRLLVLRIRIHLDCLAKDQGISASSKDTTGSIAATGCASWGQQMVEERKEEDASVSGPAK